MRVGLIDVDGHNFPNLALMRISAYHKACGDTVEWWWTDFIHYDVVYMSKIFSSAYSKDLDAPINADRVVRGGTGYSIRLEDGKEIFDGEAHKNLPDEIERMPPDYSIYPQFDFAVSMTSRGCPRGCPFCHVGKKEGRAAVSVAPVSRFWFGQKEIRVLDPNITACRDKRDLFGQYKETGAVIDFTQGLDIRLLNAEDIADINSMRLRTLHFAWDNPDEDLEESFESFARQFRRKGHGRVGMVYVLTHYGDYSTEEHIERAMQRIEKLDRLGFDPYLMIYDKPHAPREIRKLQRWCNNKILFKSVKNYKDVK